MRLSHPKEATLFIGLKPLASVCASTSKHFCNILNHTLLLVSLISDLFCSSSLTNLALNSIRKI